MSGLRAEQKMSLDIQNKFCYFVGFVIAVVLSEYLPFQRGLETTRWSEKKCLETRERYKNVTQSKMIYWTFIIEHLYLVDYVHTMGDTDKTSIWNGKFDETYSREVIWLKNK